VLRVRPSRTRHASRKTGYSGPASGYALRVASEHETRDTEQQLAAGQSETTPLIALSTVIVVIGGLVAVALALAAIAYLLA